MTLQAGEEFRLVATPSQELQRKLVYLAELDSGSVLTPGAAKRGGAAGNGRKTDSLDNAVPLIRMARLADPAYQAMSARINTDLDRMDERAVDVLQQIEHALTELRLNREKLLEQAYEDENGRRIAINADGTAAYYVDTRQQVDDATFTQIKGDLVGGPTIEAFNSYNVQISKLNERRDGILEGMAKGERLRDDLHAGAISAEEAQQRSGEIQGAMSGALSSAEDALLNVWEDEPPASGPARDKTPDEPGPANAPPLTW